MLQVGNDFLKIKFFLGCHFCANFSLVVQNNAF